MQEELKNLDTEKIDISISIKTKLMKNSNLEQSLKIMNVVLINH